MPETTVTDLRARAAARRDVAAALAVEAAQDESAAHAERKRLTAALADLDALLDELAQEDRPEEDDEAEADDESPTEVSESFASRRERLRGQLHLDTED